MKNLSYLVVAYSIVWTVLCVYIIRLTQKNKALQLELRDLQQHMDHALGQSGTSNTFSTPKASHEIGRE
ncbi:MAG: CcmD family protein [Candidatus Tectomicrobia bacterium]|uniref:CcmD family protein n=1 Tax=Tectimicrobiota bacterium TaxID=2528274 RepID=A0A938B4H4_UNCTE|nr:CcmD family protein [Candidatus Tectomicrobia bacterium]